MICRITKEIETFVIVKTNGNSYTWVWKSWPDDNVRIIFTYINQYHSTNVADTKQTFPLSQSYDLWWQLKG